MMEKTKDMAGRWQVVAMETRKRKRKGHSRTAAAGINRPPIVIAYFVGFDDAKSMKMIQSKKIEII